jgi:hypothetical protein
MKSHGSVRVVVMWCGIHTDPILRCFIDSEELSYGNMLISMVPKLVSRLRV